MTTQIQHSNAPQAQTGNRESSKRKITFNSAYDPGFCPRTTVVPVSEGIVFQIGARPSPERIAFTFNSANRPGFRTGATALPALMATTKVTIKGTVIIEKEDPVT